MCHLADIVACLVSLSIVVVASFAAVLALCGPNHTAFLPESANRRNCVWLILCLMVLAIAGSTHASAQAVSPSQNDINTLNYALYLERLESNFYAQVIQTTSQANYTAEGFPDYTYAYLQLVANHEAAHVTALSGLLGSNALPDSCTYDFSSALTSYVFRHTHTTRINT